MILEAIGVIALCAAVAWCIFGASMFGVFISETISRYTNGHGLDVWGSVHKIVKDWEYITRPETEHTKRYTKRSFEDRYMGI